MFDVEFSSLAKHFLKKAEPILTERIVQRIEKLAVDPFPTDVKRVVNKTEKIFRVRVGDHRIQYCVLYDKNLLFISDIDKRDRAYD